MDETAVLLALRESTAGAVVTRLSAMLDNRADVARPSLDDIEGYGAAEAIARRMVADLQAWRAGDVPWSEVQRAVLFFGEPGTGKSFLAQAMAGSAGITLVRGGLAQWQAAGHLGLMLAAMRRTFAEARAAAPAILVIDEIDAVGSRAGGDGHNENYRRQVINALLEELDGLACMPGVLVVGTCNHPATLDAAVLRPGRFDSKIEVPPPGRRAIARMLRDGIATTGLAPDDVGMARLIRAGGGQSAAAIDAARASARADRRPLRVEDLLAALGARAADPGVERRTALHECGHAIVAAALGIGRVTRLVLTPEGGEAWTLRATHAGVLADWEAELTRTMAGRAAERLALGTVSSGAGGNRASDLSQTTTLALQTDTHLGLGAEGPLWRGTEPALYLSVPANAARIRQRLDDAEDRAVAILARNRPLLDARGTALLEAGLLEGNELGEWLEKVAPVG